MTELEPNDALFKIIPVVEPVKSIAWNVDVSNPTEDIRNAVKQLRENYDYSDYSN